MLVNRVNRSVDQNKITGKKAYTPDACYSRWINILKLEGDHTPLLSISEDLVGEINQDRHTSQLQPFLYDP